MRESPAGQLLPAGETLGTLIAKRQIFGAPMTMHTSIKTTRQYGGKFVGPLALFVLLTASTTAAPATVYARQLPVIDGKKAVATVAGDPIGADEFKRALAASHAEAFNKGSDPNADRPPTAGRIDYHNILQRLVNTRLIVVEARNMGLDELPEIREALAAYARQTMMELLLEAHVRTIRVEASEVEPVYRNAVREWKIRSVQFAKEADAIRMRSAIDNGGDFDALTQEALDSGIAQAETAGGFLKNSDLSPAVAKIVGQMETGGVSPIVSAAKNGFILFRLEGVRYPETVDARAWKEAERQTLNDKKKRAAWEYSNGLEEKYAKPHQSLVEALDFEAAEPGIANLLKDKRVLVDILGEAPITVADLTGALKQKFFHGIDKAIAAKRVNSAAKEQLDNLIQQRVLLKEARRTGIDKTDEYLYRVNEYERGLIFGMFIERVIAPDVRLNLEELKSYYKDHLAEYSTPRMLRINELVFLKQTDALEAVDKLSKGTDFNWLAANAAGQADPEAPGLLRFGGRLLAVSGLPEGLREILADTAAGNVRLYAGPRQRYYVLQVQQVAEPVSRPFDDVKNDIAKTVYNARLKTALEDWADKLKEHYPVKVYLTDFDQL
jgi:hypothetical protein